MTYRKTSLYNFIISIDQKSFYNTENVCLVWMNLFILIDQAHIVARTSEGYEIIGLGTHSVVYNIYMDIGGFHESTQSFSLVDIPFYTTFKLYDSHCQFPSVHLVAFCAKFSRSYIKEEMYFYFRTINTFAYFLLKRFCIYLSLYVSQINLYKFNFLTRHLKKMQSESIM